MRSNTIIFKTWYTLGQAKLIHSLSPLPACVFRNRAIFSLFIIPPITIIFSPFQTRFMSKHFFYSKITDLARSQRIAQNRQVSRSFYSNVELVSQHSKQGIVWGVPQRSVCLALKPLRAYRKSSPYVVVKKEWEIKGVLSSSSRSRVMLVWRH